MSDMRQRLDKVEKRLNQISENGSPKTRVSTATFENEVDLREILSVLWGGRWWIIGITFLFVVFGGGYALTLPNVYRSEGVYAPAQKQAGGSLGGQLGSLANLAGVRVDVGESNDIAQAIALLKSWAFIETVIEDMDIKPHLLAVKSWDEKSNNLIWDLRIYDPNNEVWINTDLARGTYKAYERFRDLLHVKRDEKSGLITISLEYYDPNLTKLWLNALIVALNKRFKERDVNEALVNIEFLERKVRETGIAEMQTMLYEMIQGQIKTVMLAESNEGYLMKEVVAPKVAERKASPRRFLIVIFCCMLGGTLSVFFVIGRFYYRLSATPDRL